jgi:hypothetical protein
MEEITPEEIEMMFREPVDYSWISFKIPRDENGIPIISRRELSRDYAHLASMQPEQRLPELLYLLNRKSVLMEH